MASFSNVEAGQHQVLIAYAGFKGEQSVYLDGDVKTFNLNVTIERKAVGFSNVALLAIGILVAIIAVMGLVLFRVTKKKRIPALKHLK